MAFYSVIVPVYNRPQQADELLDSLTKQSFCDFEVLIIEDGSIDHCRGVVDKYRNQLDISYYYKENSGQGFSRNYGFQRAKGDYFIVFDSDCLIPEHYLKTVEQTLNAHPIDAFGGPDKAHHSFTNVQKAISYAMTSPLTTAGIRGNKRHAGTFHPRGFNMGISREVYHKTKGYRMTRMSEDIEFSIRIIENGFKTTLIEHAYVYHKRRTSFGQFYKQIHCFGRSKINISRLFPKAIKLVHTYPALFTLGLLLLPVTFLLDNRLSALAVGVYGFFFLLNFVLATIEGKSLLIGLLGAMAAFTQLIAYGTGFLSQLCKRLFDK